MLPLFKIGVILIRQISKPVSGYIKKKAIENKNFKNICIYCGKKYYNFEQYIQKKFYNANITDVKYSSFISESKSVNIGSEILGEGFIFLIAALFIVAEYKRNSLKEEKKELILNHKLETLKLQISELQKENDEIMKIVLPNKKNIRDNRSFDLVHTNFFKDIFNKFIYQPKKTITEQKELTEGEVEKPLQIIEVNKNENVELKKG
ncbi:OPA3-like protein, putative [Hepatocystis sp. ex Piliocolobus tephrosceles]|nr:OPA3-like protein, putative [Hepatocystis sp. ex Piliocolobus tephrosceles]